MAGAPVDADGEDHAYAPAHTGIAEVPRIVLGQDISSDLDEVGAAASIAFAVPARAAAAARAGTLGLADARPPTRCRRRSRTDRNLGNYGAATRRRAGRGSGASNLRSGRGLRFWTWL